LPRVLITTTYSTNSIVLLVTKLGIERLYLLMDKKPDKTQKKAAKTIEASFGKAIKVKRKRVGLYDVVGIAKECVILIDDIPDKDELYLNVTPGRKTQSMGLLLGSYARSNRVKKALYCIEETNQILDLPVLSFNLNKSQLKILKNIEESKNLSKFAEHLKISRAMLYRHIKELRVRGLIEENKENELLLTDAGRIARL